MTYKTLKEGIKMIVDKVAAKNFYKDRGDKIKQNWFLYEYSNILFSKIAESPQLAQYRKKHTEEDIAEFCVYYSKRLRLSIFNANIGKNKSSRQEFLQRPRR